MNFPALLSTEFSKQIDKFSAANGQLNHCLINNHTVKTSKQLHVDDPRHKMEPKSPKKKETKKKYELCHFVTNPLGDPYFDFVKDVMIENLLMEIEHEVHWRLLRIPESEEPQIVNLIEAKSGKNLGSKHLPFCRCPKCQKSSNLHLMKKLRWQNKSPYHMWKLTSKIQYLDAKNPGKHCEFCRCEAKCQRKAIFKMIRTVQETGRETLKKSEFGRVELNENAPGYNPNIFDVRIWKNGLINWALEAIEKRHRKLSTKIIA